MDFAGQDAERADWSDSHLVTQGVERQWDDQAAAERREVEWAATSWHALATGSVGHTVDISQVNGSSVSGTCVDSGRGWCLIDSGARYSMVFLDHVVTFRGVARVPPQAPVQRGAGAVLRRWARMRELVSVELVNGRQIVGRVGEVLSDAICVVIDAEPQQRVVVPLSAVLSVSASVIDIE